MRFAAICAGALVAGASAPASAQTAARCTAIGTPARNVALVKGFYRALVTHSKATLDTVHADDWADVPLAPGQGPGVAGMKAAMDGYYRSFPDVTPTNDDFIASGDKVVVRSTITATQRGPFAGVPASNRKISIMAVDIHQICNGRVVRTWHVEDWLSGLFQLGGLPPK